MLIGWWLSCWCCCDWGRWSAVTGTNARARRCLLDQLVDDESIRARPKTPVHQVICVKRIPATSRKATCASVSVCTHYAVDSTSDVNTLATETRSPKFWLGIPLFLSRKIGAIWNYWQLRHFPSSSSSGQLLGIVDAEHVDKMWHFKCYQTSFFQAKNALKSRQP